MRHLVLAIMGAFLLIAFQNCSKVDPSRLEGALSDSTNVLSGSEAQIDNNGNEVDQTQVEPPAEVDHGGEVAEHEHPDNGQEHPDHNQGGGEVAEHEHPDHNQGGEEVKEPDHSHGGGQVESQQPDRGHGGGGQVAETEEHGGGCSKSKGKESSASKKKNDAVVMSADPDKQECLQAKNKILLDRPSTVEHLRGSFIVGVQNVRQVKDVNGKLIMVGLSSDAVVDRIEDFEGKLILCGVRVNKVVKTKGDLVVVDGSIGVLQDKRGNLRLIDSKVDNRFDIAANSR